MYTVKIDDETLYIPGDKNFAITSPVLDLVLGGSGSFNFTIPKTNPRYDVVYNRKSMVSVFRDGKEIFYGEVRSQDTEITIMSVKSVRMSIVEILPIKVLYLTLRHKASIWHLHRRPHQMHPHIPQCFAFLVQAVFIRSTDYI